MKTAHQSIIASRSSEKNETKDTALFAWNHTDASQFNISHAKSEGWSVSFVGATASKSEHLLVTVAEGNSPSSAFLMVDKGLPEADFDMVVVHGFFNTSDQQSVYCLVRAGDVKSGVYAGCKWGYPSGGLIGFYNETTGEQNITNLIEATPHSKDSSGLIIETHVSVRGVLLGCGLGRISGYGNIDATVQTGLALSKVIGIGFMLPVLSKPLSIEIYDLVARKRVS